jgi:Flp pilus assembly protein TadG
MKHLGNQPRRGATTVEFAIVVPLVFLFFFAAYEYSRMSMIRHSVELAAYEGARRGIVPGATAGDAVARANQVLSSVGTRNASLTVTPDPITAQSSRITVDIQVPLDSNSWVPVGFLRGAQVQRTFTLGRENVKW